MKYIVVDLEMNPIGEEYNVQRKVCGDEVIEIGAVVLDEKYEECDSFVTYVKPQMNTEITKYITNLTGITTEQVQEAPCFQEAVNMFFDWCESIQEDVTVFQWSDRDYDQLFREINLKKVKLTASQKKIFRDWKDFQREFTDLLGLDNQISLKNALYYAGADFEGRQHDALYDARNTGFLVKTVNTPSLRKQALDRVISALNPEIVENTMGDLFDFSKLGLMA